jgi:thiamine biosynthesis protein ThiI
MSPSTESPILLMVRLGAEVSTKSRRTRRRFQRRLVRNIEDALESSGFAHRVEDRWNRILVETDDREALDRVATVFGVSSLSPVDARVDAQLETIVETGAQLYGDLVKGRRYAVECRRQGKHGFSSQDVKRKLGAALNADATVDLDHPEVTVEVEVREGVAYLLHERIPGHGGLPLGVQGTAVCLISGGYDSAAAAWLMLKRGIRLEYVFCNLAGAAYERSVVMVARVLAEEWSHGHHPRLHVVPFEETVEALRESVTPRYWQVVLKRLMYRAAESIATEVRGEAVITGESLGQVSSQTLGNLRAIDEVASLPVFRPLIGMDKHDIIDLTETVGTAALSARIREYCAILPDRPVTHSKPAAARDEASKVDPAVVERAVADRKILDLRELNARDLVEPYVFTDEIRPHATVLDCRSSHHYRAWHYPGAVRCDPRDLPARVAELDKERSYVLYCDQGVLSAQFAELMQRLGYDAYSFRGGTRALERWATKAAPADQTSSDQALAGP